MDIFREPVQHVSAWTGAAMRGSGGWIVEWPVEVVAEIESTAQGLRCAAPAFKRKDFPLPRCAAFLDGVMREIVSGRGFVLLRGLPIHKYDSQFLRNLYWGLGCHWGTPMTQNMAGEAMAEIGDFGVNVSRGPESPHSDPCDVASLLCVRPAMEGGLARIASSMAIYNRLLEVCPHGLECLYRGFHHDLWGDETPHAPFGCTPVPIPVYRWYHGVLSCAFNASTTRQGAQRMGRELPEAEQVLLDYIVELAHGDEFRIDMAFEPGDIRLLNNHTILHWRTGYRDWPEPERKRRLLRMWIDRCDERPVDPAFRRGCLTGANAGLPVLP